MSCGECRATTGHKLSCSQADVQRIELPVTASPAPRSAEAQPCGCREDRKCPAHGGPLPDCTGAGYKASTREHASRSASPQPTNPFPERNGLISSMNAQHVAWNEGYAAAMVAMRFDAERGRASPQPEPREWKREPYDVDQSDASRAVTYLKRIGMPGKSGEILKCAAYLCDEVLTPIRAYEREQVSSNASPDPFHGPDCERVKSWWRPGMGCHCSPQYAEGYRLGFENGVRATGSPQTTGQHRGHDDALWRDAAAFIYGRFDESGNDDDVLALVLLLEKWRAKT